MLYKHKNSSELDMHLFKNPTSEYRAAPFWGWNTKLEPDVLMRQIEYFKEMGFGGFHIHSRAGLSDVYLGDYYMDCVKQCIDKAEQMNMLSWIYDEDICPSGFAGGYVTKIPRFRQRYLALAPYDSSMPEFYEFEEAVEKGKAYYICSFDIELNEDGTLKNYSIADKNEVLRTSRWIAYCAVPDDDVYGGYPYVDVLNRDATEEFIRVTHERFKEIAGECFGTVIPAIFTDEPQLFPKGRLKFATDRDTVAFPWTPMMPELFEKSKGESLIAKIPELFWNLPDNKVSEFRYKVHDFITELFVSSFADVLGNWCAKNNLLLTGHMKDEPSLYWQTLTIGEAMRHYRNFQLPGVDILCDDHEYCNVKQAQSVAHQYGREGVLSELYGVTDWDYDFRGHKTQGDWQAALGVTMRVPHISWLSMEGMGKRDFPASINYQSPWYKEYKYIEDHFARLATVLTRGKPVVKIGVIHPSESYWLHWADEEHTSDIRTNLDDKFQNLAKWLLFSALDFDYICEAHIPSLHKASDTAKFNVGHMDYDVILISDMITVRRSTYDALKEFAEKGGTVIFAGSCPEYIDAEKTDEVFELYKKSSVIPYDKFSITKELNRYRDIEIYDNNGEKSNQFLYTMRAEEHCKWLFVARGRSVAGEERHDDNGTTYYDTNVPLCDTVKIKINGEYVPEIYNTLTGNTEKIRFEYISGATVVYYGMYAESSLLLKLTPGTDVCTYEDESPEEGEDYRIFGKHLYELDEPNVLLLDRAEYSIDDEMYGQEEMQRIEKKIYEKYNLRQHLQPYIRSDFNIGHTLTLNIRINSEMEFEGALLAAEKPESKEFWLNGEHLNPTIEGYFTDEYIKTFRIPALKCGSNLLTIKIPLTERTNIEWCYILGDFGVLTEGTETTIVRKKDKIGYSPLKMQLMPFYGGNITYINEIEVDDCDIDIAVPYYIGAAVKVYVDDVDCGNISLSPYKTTVKNLRKGRHTVKIKLFGNRYNSFGPLHNTNTSLKWFGPNAWQTDDKEFSYEYQLSDMGVLASPKITVYKKKGD